MERLARELTMTGDSTAAVKRAPRQSRSGLAGPLLVAPLLAVMALLVAVPIGWEVWHSLMAPRFTAAYYAQLATGRAYPHSLLVTVQIAALVTLICLVPAYVVAYVLAGIGRRLGAVLLAATIVPFWISAVVRSFAWILMLQRGGVVDGGIRGLGLLERPTSLVGTSAAVYVAMASVLLPVMVLPMFNAMRDLDRDLLRAAASLGASRWRAFREVFLPLSLPGVAAGCLLVFIMSLGYFITPSMLGGAKDTMVAVLIYQQTQSFQWPAAFALSAVLLVVILALYAVASVTVGLGRLLIGAHRT